MLEQPTVLFCTGLSGSGKTYFIKNVLPNGAFYNLKSATTRKMRDGEADGREYYFRDEKYFETENFATKLFVNEQFWKPGEQKWLYGVPEFEIWDHWGANFTYDVIQPRYVRQMIEWFHKNDKTNKYTFRILWFLPMTNNMSIAEKRQNMPNDLQVRKTNTCNQKDFEMARLEPDHIVVCNEISGVAIDKRLREFINSVTPLKTR